MWSICSDAAIWIDTKTPEWVLNVSESFSMVNSFGPLGCNLIVHPHNIIFRNGHKKNGKEYKIWHNRPIYLYTKLLIYTSEYVFN